MKTIKIPEELHRLLKIRAAETDRDLQGLVEEALRAGLVRPSPKPKPSPKK
jgi:plasmid stability protein